jgi:hypothetical protein
MAHAVGEMLFTDEDAAERFRRQRFDEGYTPRVYRRMTQRRGEPHIIVRWYDTEKTRARENARLK